MCVDAHLSVHGLKQSYDCKLIRIEGFRYPRFSQADFVFLLYKGKNAMACKGPEIRGEYSHQKHAPACNCQGKYGGPRWFGHGNLPF
jgi:hypothetical protein